MNTNKQTNKQHKTNNESLQTNGENKRRERKQNKNSMGREGGKKQEEKRPVVLIDVDGKEYKILLNDFDLPLLRPTPDL